MSKFNVGDLIPDVIKRNPKKTAVAAATVAIAGGIAGTYAAYPEWYVSTYNTAYNTLGTLFNQGVDFFASSPLAQLLGIGVVGALIGIAAGYAMGKKDENPKASEDSEASKKKGVWNAIKNNPRKTVGGITLLIATGVVLAGLNTLGYVPLDVVGDAFSQAFDFMANTHTGNLIAAGVGSLLFAMIMMMLGTKAIEKGAAKQVNDSSAQEDMPIKIRDIHDAAAAPAAHRTNGLETVPQGEDPLSKL